MTVALTDHYGLQGQGGLALAATDRDLREAAQHNVEVGYWLLSGGPEPLFDKIAQHRAIRALAPDMAFDAVVVQDATDLPSRPPSTTVIRPALSPSSRGCAAMAGPDLPLSTEDRARFSTQGGPFLVHEYVAGTPFFVNGVMSGGFLTVSDIWECGLWQVDCRPILVSVINATLANLPVGTRDALETLARGLGILAGPVHFEIIRTDAGSVKLVKFAPRLASSPLPELCTLAGMPTQEARLGQAQRGNFDKHLPGGPPPRRHVADYSFSFSRSGRLRSIRANCAQSLDSVCVVFHAVPAGTDVRATHDGLSYGLTLFLANASRGALRADIAQLQRFQSEGVFDYD